jgi:hypothetical protein
VCMGGIGSLYKVVRAIGRKGVNNNNRLTRICNISRNMVDSGTDQADLLQVAIMTSTTTTAPVGHYLSCPVSLVI